MSLADLAQRHRLDAVPPERWSAHLPGDVLRSLDGTECVVFAVDDAASDTARFSERYGIGMEDCANTIVLRYTRDGAQHHAAVVTLGANRLDVNGSVKRALGAQRLSFAAREAATELTGMEFGGITVYGLPAGMRILIDAAVMTRAYVVLGAGIRRTKILLAPEALMRLAGAEVAPLALAPAA